jgi:hypothetical protein
LLVGSRDKVSFRVSGGLGKGFIGNSLNLLEQCGVAGNISHPIGGRDNLVLHGTGIGVFEEGSGNKGKGKISVK